MYTVIDGTARKIDLQAYAGEEPKGLEGAVGFAPKDTSIPKDLEAPGKSRSQSSRPSDLSTIDEQTEMSSKLTHKDFRENRQRFKEPPSISSACETPQEIMTEDVDRAYKKKNACCSQRLTMIYQNQAIEKEMAQNDLEKQAINDFYEEYKK